MDNDYRKRHFYYCCGWCRPVDKFDIFLAKLALFGLRVTVAIFILFAIFLIFLL